jgi:hypothetical protein
MDDYDSIDVPLDHRLDLLVLLVIIHVGNCFQYGPSPLGRLAPHAVESRYPKGRDQAVKENGDGAFARSFGEGGSRQSGDEQAVEGSPVDVHLPPHLL